MTDLRRIDVNLLVVLDALLRHRNLTHAGKDLGMSQPAVSGALARLRVQFADPILIRKGKNFELTTRATEIQHLVEHAMSEVNRTYALVPDFEPMTSLRTFHIAATDYLLSQLASPLKQAMTTDAPNVTLEFSTLTSDLEIGLIDLVRRDVLIGSPTLMMPGKKTKIFTDRLVCIARQGHPFVHDGAMSLEDMKRSELIQVVIGKRGGNAVDSALFEFGLIDRVGVSVTSVMAVPAMVSGTNLISWCPERLFNDYKDVLGLQIIDTPIAPITFDLSAHWHPSKSNDPAIQWLITKLQQSARRI